MPMPQTPSRRSKGCRIFWYKPPVDYAPFKDLAQKEMEGPDTEANETDDKEHRTGDALRS